MDTKWHKRIDRQFRRCERYAELARGKLLVMRGARAGRSFGVGRHVHVIGAYCLFIGDFVTIQGPGYLNCLSAKGVSIGDHSSIDCNLWLHCGGRVDKGAPGYFSLGNNSYVGCNAVIGAGGGVEIRDNVLIGQSVNIHAENHNFRDSTRLIREQGVTYKGIVIEDDVWIGSKATIVDGVTIGQGAVIGAGSVVTKSIPAYAIAVGVPARVIGTRGEDRS